MNRPFTAELGGRKPELRKLAPAAVSLVLMATGCTSQHNETAKPSSSPEALAVRADALWLQATYELRDKVKAGKPVDLRVAKDQCLYWPAASDGIFTLQRNPIMYDFMKDNETVALIPFVPSSPTDLEVMNGPYEYSDTEHVGSGIGSMGAVVFSGDVLVFTKLRTVVTLEQAPHPTPFTAAWMRTEEGTRIGETQLVEEKNLETTFKKFCHNIPFPEPHISGADHSPANA